MFADVAVVTWCWCDIGVGVVSVLFDWSVCRICHFGGSLESNCTVGAATIGVAADAGIVWTVAGWSALAGITCTFPRPGIFCTGIDCRKPFVAFIPPAGWSCIILPLPMPLIMLPGWAVKFANADAGISVNCCPWAPTEQKEIWMKINWFFRTFAFDTYLQLLGVGQIVGLIARWVYVWLVHSLIAWHQYWLL